MRKDRNTFFSESNMFQSNYPGQQMMGGQPMMNNQPMMQPMMQNPAPYQQSTASNSFYVGPNPGVVPNQMPVENYQTNNTAVTNLESRLAKMERQIRRLETRLNKLESNYTTAPIEEIDTNYSSSMYMI